MRVQSFKSSDYQEKNNREHREGYVSSNDDGANVANDAFMRDVNHERARTSTLMMCHDDQELLSKALDMFSAAVEGADHIINIMHQFIDHAETELLRMRNGERASALPLREMIVMVEDVVGRIKYGNQMLLDGRYGPKELVFKGEAVDYLACATGDENTDIACDVELSGFEHCPHLIGKLGGVAIEPMEGNAIRFRCVIAGEVFYTEGFLPTTLASKRELAWEHSHIPDVAFFAACREGFAWLLTENGGCDLVALKSWLSRIAIYQTRKIRLSESLESMTGIEVCLTHSNAEPLTFCPPDLGEESPIAFRIGGHRYRMKQSSLMMDASHYTATQHVTFVDEMDEYQQLAICCHQRGTVCFGPQADPQAIASILQHLFEVYHYGGYEIAYGLGKSKQFTVVIPSFKMSHLFHGGTMHIEDEMLPHELEDVLSITKNAHARAVEQKIQLLVKIEQCERAIAETSDNIQALST